MAARITEAFNEMADKVAALERRVADLERSPQLGLWLTDLAKRRELEARNARWRALREGPPGELAAAVAEMGAEELEGFARGLTADHVAALPAAERDRALGAMADAQRAKIVFAICQPAPRYSRVTTMRPEPCVSVVPTARAPQPDADTLVDELDERHAREHALKAWWASARAGGRLPLPPVEVSP